jgi:uncharacterized repeat protein (TIGR03837 family)
MLKSIDIFCDIIDNFGDIGFVYRLAREIKKKEPLLEVRVFLNDLETFSKINKRISTEEKIQKIEDVIYYDMRKMTEGDYIEAGNGQVGIEAYGCDIPEIYLENRSGNLEIVINIEYLTAEDWAKEYHLQSSFINVKNVKKYFYMPGFEDWSGGLIIPEHKISENRLEFFQKIISSHSEKKIIKNSDNFLKENTFIGTIFSYEYNFENLLNTLENNGKKVLLLVFGDMSKKGFLVTDRIKNLKNVDLIFMDYVEQDLYDQILYNSDFNLVRGEESFARAIVSGKPFLWHAYCQEEQEHINKVNGFLSFIEKEFPKKIFEEYVQTMHNYNSREENHYILEDENFRSFFIDFNKKETIFQSISVYIRKNGNLVNKLIDFLKNKLEN